MANISEIIESNKPEPIQPGPQQTENTPDIYNISGYLAQADPDYIQPVENYTGAYAEEIPQGVISAQDEFNQVNVATQEYADEWTARIIADRNGYMTDDNYQGALNKTYTNQIYDYLKRANHGADESAWETPNPEDDLFTRWLPEWSQAFELERQARDQLDKPIETDETKLITGNVSANMNEAQRDIMNAKNMEHGNYNLLSWWDKAKYLLIPGSSATTMDDAPDWAKYIQNIFPSLMASGAGMMVGSLAGPVGATIGAVAVGALTYLQGVTGIRIPVINEALEALDILSVWFEQGQGAVGAGFKEAQRRLDGQEHGLLDLLKTTADVLKDPNNKYLWDVGKYSYEMSADLGFDDLALFLRNAGAKFSDKYLGTNFGQRTIDQVSRANIGRGGLENVMEGTQGYQALYDTALPVFTGLVEEAMKYGMSETQAKEFAHQNMEEYMLNYFGSSGLSRDLVASSVADPMNFVPFVSAKLTEGVGKLTGNTALQSAGKAAAGNVFIDALPPGIQQLAEGVTGKHGSQGWDAIVRTYGENLRTIPDSGKLSWLQRNIAGLNKDGVVKDTLPNPKSGNVVLDWFRNLGRTTNDTKMFDVTGMSSDFLGSVIFNGDTETYKIPDMIDQIAGKKPITPDSPIARWQNTAVFKTLRDAYSSLDDATLARIARDVQNYGMYGQNRAVVDYVAQQLGMTVDEVFDALDNKGINPRDQKYRDMTKQERKAALDAERQQLYRKIREAGLTYDDGNGTVLDTNKIIREIEVFMEPKGGSRTAGRRQYSDTYLRASIMESVANTVDSYNLARYDIQPDNWAVRTSNLMKSMQSIALLNFSTSYQVNNFLNNLITRSVSGVGGIAPKTMMEINKKRGLTFSRKGEMYEGTKKVIDRAKTASGPLQKITDLYNNIADKKIFKGVNNIDVEGIETTAAANIGMNRYWDATWGNNIPEKPKAWEALGITRDMQNQIFKIELDSPNLEAFRTKLMGEYVIPEARSTLNQMLTNNYTPDQGRIIGDFISKNPWMSEMVDALLQTGDERIIVKGFDELLNRFTSDVELKNVVQLESTFESLRNRYANEGVGAVATAWEALNDMYAQFWINQTKENTTLFLDRIAQTLTPEEFDKRYKAYTDIQTNDYNMVRGYAVMNMAALIDGLGLDNEVGKALLNNVMTIFDTGESFIKIEHEMYKKNAVKSSPDYDIKKWQTEKVEALTQTLDAQLKAYEAMHKTLIDYLRNNLSSDWTGQIDLLEQSLKEVVKLQTENNKAEIKESKRRVNTDYKRRRAMVSNEQRTPRYKRKQAIHDSYDVIARQLKQLETGMNGKLQPASPSTLESTLKMELLYEEGRNMAKRAGDFLNKYKDGDNPAPVYQPLNFENRNIKTTFVEYEYNRIVNEAIKAGKSPELEWAKNGSNFLNGEAVNLGSADVTRKLKYYDEATNTWIDHPVLDHFQLLNPDVDPKVPGSKFSMARCEPYQYGGSIVNAGVFEDGKIIAYITEGMKQSITVDGKTYPVIGISPTDPNSYVLYVGDKSRVVTPGKPRGVEYTAYAKENFHPGGIDTTPSIEPWGEAALETSYGMRDAIRKWREQAISDLRKAQENGSFYDKLNEAQRQAVFEYMDGDLRQAYNMQRYQTQRYGETMVDASLLNYNKRYGFDNMLTMICPYQFWMTRSLANWGKRMISQPAWFSMYARLQKLIEKNKKDFLPTRLNGLVGIPMPAMGDGMGDSFYFDPFNIMLPFQQFYNATDYFVKNLNTVHNNTLDRIDQMYQDGELFNGKPITEDMYYEAVDEGKGDLYWTIFKQEQENDETDTTASGLLGTFFGPPVWVDALRKHMAGKDKDISYSPMFRLGNMIKAAGDDTFAEDITNFVGGTLQLPENALRGVFGIESNPDGNFADYGVLSIIANMQTNYEISENEALNAIAEGPGNEIYDKALHQYRQQQAYRQQGGALVTEIGQSLGGNKDTSLGQLAGSALVSLFGGKVLPEGERMHREHQQQYRDIVRHLDKKSDEYRKFWEDNPDYQTHSYAYEDDPEKRYHRVLVDNLTNAYYALPYDQQIAVQRALPDRFYELFVNKDTRATDYLDNDELIQWTRAMQGNTPNINTNEIDKAYRGAIDVKWYADSVQGDYDRYIKTRDRKFPGIKEVEDGYYAIPQSMREKYLAENPMLQAYWDWDKAVKASNPQLAVFINDRSAQYQVDYGRYDNITDAVMSKLNDWTLKQLQNHIENGWAINPSAERTLRTVYASLQVNVPYETWLKSLVK